MMNIHLCRSLSVRLGTLHFRYTPALATIVTYQTQHNNTSPCLKLTSNISMVSQKELSQKYSTSVLDVKLGLWDRLKESVGFQGKLRYPKQVMTLSSYKMYISMTQIVNYDEIMEVLKLPDTFNSWFLVTELHVWMCMVRLTQDGREGRFFRNCLVSAMWSDVKTRSQKLGDSASFTARKEGIKHLGDGFYAALFSYDEGLLGDDRDLAASLWRILFEMRDIDPSLLEIMVAYVRKQMNHLDSQASGVILSSGLVTFLPLVGDEIDRKKHNSVFKAIQSQTFRL